MMKLPNLAVAFVVLNALDQISTWYGLQHGGSEGNPIFRYLFTTIGFGWATVVKIVLAIWLVFLLDEAARRWPKWENRIGNGLAALCGAYTVAVISNFVRI